MSSTPGYILSAYKQGYKAYKEGKTRKDNPFTLNQHNEDQWDKGYSDAEKASKDQNNQFTSHEQL